MDESGMAGKTAIYNSKGMDILSNDAKRWENLLTVAKGYEKRIESKLDDIVTKVDQLTSKLDSNQHQTMRSYSEVAQQPAYGSRVKHQRNTSSVVFISEPNRGNAVNSSIVLTKIKKLLLKNAALKIDNHKIFETSVMLIFGKEVDRDRFIQEAQKEYREFRVELPKKLQPCILI